MSHPQPPSGSPDPNQQPQEPPTQAFPTAPMPPVPGNPYAPPPAPTSGSPYPPPSDAPQPPLPGAPYPPPGSEYQQPGAAYQPPGGAYPPPGGEYQPPGAAYQPPGGEYQQPGGYPPPGGGAYPPPPGAPFGPPAKKSNKNVWITVGIIAVILLLLCCGGGIFAIYSGAKKTQEAIDSLPTPGVTYGQPTGDTPTGAPTGTPQPGNSDDKTFNMPAGDKLVVNDDRGTIEITVGNFRTRNAACSEVMPGPKNGMFLIADVTAEITKGTGSINPFYFTWVAADGTEESGIGGAFSGCGKLMTSGTNLPEGSKRSGQLIFDVKDQNGVVEYKHRFRSAGSWKP
ncbi:hypothetical protein O7622_07745 [Micromonospora sp. WMMD1076]|uniref:hypothetical protein n=1 Tax=Micromonospora sp. WMMD1076 TaxID=3016103 RepID=UPI00249C341E|nr:hypothetical protein [Micromonospora sp. WMMD1076]WFF08437.1 hypothetical protein O7622_07745 [Micromonospora sp. WMMD1076]